MEHPQITHIQRTGYPKEDIGDRVRPYPVSLPDGFYDSINDWNDRRAAQCRAESKRRAEGR